MEQTLVYLRISEDRTGQEAGVDRQQEDCVRHAKNLGEDAPAIFIDNDISAFKNKHRPSYEQLMERVRTGPTRIVVWHVDRLYRKPRELEDLIDLVESHPIKIEAVKGGAFDLNTHEGRLMARQLVAIASYESGHKADRIQRANLQKAKRGEWHGGPRFGYGRGGVLIPEEAQIIREAADRFLAGQSLRSITRWMNEIGARPTFAGAGTLGVWHSNSVREVLASARISGQRAYEPRNASPSSINRSIIGPGNWDPIITPEETLRIRAMLAAPDRRTSTSSVNLLSGIASCGICGAGLVSASFSGHNKPSQRRAYVCKKVTGRPERGGIRISAYRLDDLVKASVIARLGSSSLDHIPAGGPESPVAKATQVILHTKERMDDLARAYGAGTIARSEYYSARTAAAARMVTAQTELATVSRNKALESVPLGDEDAVRERWNSATIPERRAILGVLIDKLVIHRARSPRRGPRFDVERVELTYKA